MYFNNNALAEFNIAPPELVEEIARLQQLLDNEAELRSSIEWSVRTEVSQVMAEALACSERTSRDQAEQEVKLVVNNLGQFTADHGVTRPVSKTSKSYRRLV